MINIEEFTSVAADFKVSKLKAEEQGIYEYYKSSDDFQMSAKTFKEIKGDRDYQVGIFDRYDKDYKYIYKVKIAGLTFFTLSSFLLYKGDEKRFERSQDENKMMEVE